MPSNPRVNHRYNKAARIRDSIESAIVEDDEEGYEQSFHQSEENLDSQIQMYEKTDQDSHGKNLWPMNEYDERGISQNSLKSFNRKTRKSKDTDV